MFFKRKLNCHHEFKSVGRYYKTYLTQYRNHYDEVVVYNRYICSKCGYVHNEEILQEHFLPEIYTHYETKKQEYIMRLEKSGVFDETKFTIGG